MTTFTPLQEMEVAGLRVRLVAHCEEDNCRTQLVVAAEPDQDCWLYFAEVRPHSEDYDLKAALADVLDCETLAATRRWMAVFGVSWRNLTPDVIERQAFITEAPPWLEQELAEQTPEELRRLRELILDGEVWTFVRMMRSIGSYRRSTQ